MSEIRDFGMSTLSVRSSRSSNGAEDEFIDEKFVIQEEPAIVILPMDSSVHSQYCLEFYIQFIHRIGNKVHVLTVSEDFRNKNFLIPKMSKELDLKKQTTKGDKEKPVLQKDELAAKIAKMSKPNRCCPCRNLFGPRHTHGLSPGKMVELENEDKMKCRELKKKVKKYFRSNGVLFEFHRLVSDDKPKAIVLFTQLADGHMIVIGSKDLGAVKKNLVGSVSESVLRHARVPVVVVKNIHPHYSLQQLKLKEKEKETTIH